MTTTRRSFMATAAVALTATGLDACKPSSKQNPKSQKGLPIVISTWKHTDANNAASASLQKGGSSLDAVEAGARVPEADPNDTSVGYGGLPDRDGHVTLDACIMDWKGGAGSVTFLEGIMHPISVARKVMEKTPHVMLSGDGALQFALAEGFVKENLLTESSKKAWEAWKETSKYQPIANIERHDTIGVLAIDQANHISGACTTSGMAYKMHGRVGDSPIIGGAVFVDDEVGGACATGVGEFVMKTLGSFLIVELMRNGKSPQEACEEAVNRIIKRYGQDKDRQVGYLVIDKDGQHGAFALLKGFNYTITQNGKTEVIDAGFYQG